MTERQKIEKIEKILDKNLKDNDINIKKIILNYLFQKCSGCNYWKYYDTFYCSTCSFMY